jgi:WD40 repeat protein
MLTLSALQKLYLPIFLIITSIIIPNRNNHTTNPFTAKFSRQDHPWPIACASWSPDGKWIAVCQQENILLYTEDLKTKISLKGHSKFINSISWKPDSTLLASGSDDETIRIWDVQTRQTINIYRGYSDIITNVRWSPDGTLIASTSEFNSPKSDFQIWEPSSKTYKYSFPTNYTEPQLEAFLTSIAWKPDSTQIAVSKESVGVGIWDIRTQKIALQVAKIYTIRDIAWSPDGNKIAVVGGGDADEPGYSSLWNSKTGELLFSLRGHKNWVFSVAWSPDGNYLATSSEDQTIKLWDSANGKLLKDLAFPNADKFIWPNSITWNPDSKRIAFTVGLQQVCIWDILTEERPNCVDIPTD